MGWQSELNGRCKKHPKHRQSPGVCSTCLKERLTQVIASSSSSSAKRNNRITTASSSYSSSLSSTSSEVSSCASPMSTSSLKVPIGSYNNLSSSNTGKDNINGLTRSRSMASVARSWIVDSMRMRSTVREPNKMSNKKKLESSTNDSKSKKKKSGFWSKLLVGSYSRKNKEVVQVMRHSKTVEETSITSVF